MGKLIFFLITVLFISIATKLYKGQWSWFIPEYNMLPEDKKKEYNKNILFAISCGLFVISMFFLIFWMLINNGGKK